MSDTKRWIGSRWWVFAALGCAAATTAMMGCELIVDFDRSKIPQGPADGSVSFDGGGTPDATSDTFVADTSTSDGADAADGSDGSLDGAPGSDGSPPDASGDGSGDAALDSSDGASGDDGSDSSAADGDDSG